jgi:hypothetical protein
MILNDFEICNRLPTDILTRIMLSSANNILKMENLWGNTIEIKFRDILNKYPYHRLYIYDIYNILFEKQLGMILNY